MTQRVILHVGCPKTGTSALQHLLATNPDALAHQGFLYPASPDGFEQHFAATRDLHGNPLDEEGPLGPGAWDGLAAEVRAWPGTAIISHELLASCTPAQVKRAVESLGDADVQVVITARDLARQIPSGWQENVKHGFAKTMPQFIAGINGPERGPDREPFVRWFWAVQDLPHIAMRWATGVGPANVTMVTVPATSSSNLIERFGDAIGLDTSPLRRDHDRSNSSMGIAETEFLRRFNEAFAADVPESVYHEVIREHVVRLALAPHRNSPSLSLPPTEFEWVRARAERWVKTIEQAGYRVVGDLQDLVPVRADATAFDPDVFDESLVLDAAIRALAGAVDAYADVHAQLEEAQQALAMPTRVERIKSGVLRRLETSSSGRRMLGVWRERQR